MNKDYFEKFILQNINKNIIPKNKKILITGSNGFIGRYLVYVLANIFKSHKNLIYGIDINKNLNFSKNYIYFKKDLTLLKKRNLPKIIFDYVIHLAGIPSPVYYKKFPLKTIYLNAELSRELMEISKKNRSNFAYFSSSEIYGQAKIHPQKESYFGNVNPIGPRGVYDEAKRYLEAMTMAYHNKRKLNTKIVRIFNTYGPRMRIDDGRAIPTFINQALNNKDLTVFGNGNQTRSFCYIDDTVEGISKLLDCKYNYPVNIGNPVEFTILELTEKIKKLTDSESKIIYKKLPENDPNVRRPNIELAKNILKWEPKVKLNDVKTESIEIDKEAQLQKMVEFERERQLTRFSTLYYKRIYNNSEIDDM